MNGTEFDGWELVKRSVANAPNGPEKVYMWNRNESKGEDLVQVRVIENSNWRNALRFHHDQLMQSMRPNIPRGKGRTAGIGDIQHVGQTPDNEITAMIFTRGNLQVSVTSIGLNPVDVTALAKALDDKLANPPTTDSAEKKPVASRQKPLKVTAKKNEMTVLIDTLPEPTPESGWTRVVATSGEIRKEGNTLYLIDEQGGDRIIEIINYKLT